jgi:hypothetical protein
MKPLKSRIALLKELITLEERRECAAQQLGSIMQQISSLHKILYGAPSSNSNGINGGYFAQNGANALHDSGKRRGALKGQIIEALQAAGESGASVQELAALLGTKTTNVHSWFNANLGKIHGIQKVGASHYMLNGEFEQNNPDVFTARRSFTIAPRFKARQGFGRMPARRGELKTQILDALKEAGDAGVTIRELAEKLDARYKNIYIWFVTTGKRIGGISKVGPARYRLDPQPV